MKTISSGVLLALFLFVNPLFAKNSTQGLKIETDKFTNFTSIETETIKAKIKGESPLDIYLLTLNKFTAMDVSKLFNDNQKHIIYHSPPMSVNITSISTKWRFLDNKKVDLLLDGITRKNDITPYYRKDILESGMVLESVYFTIDHDELKEIAFANTFEARVGLSEFSLSYKDRESWRNLFNYLDEIKNKTIAENEGTK